MEVFIQLGLFDEIEREASLLEKYKPGIRGPWASLTSGAFYIAVGVNTRTFRYWPYMRSVGYSRAQFEQNLIDNCSVELILPGEKNV